MFATFRLSLEELDNNFLEKVKSIFPESTLIEIKIFNEADETEYLLSTPENRESIMKSLEQMKNNDEN